MRISVVPDDPGYLPRMLDPVRITCNGVVVPLCLTADDVEGVVRHYRLDGRGLLVRDDHGAPLVDEKRGHVVIDIMHDGTLSAHWPARG
jgi:hypothetical protein